MTMAATPRVARDVSNGVPALEAGDHLDQATFHARYKAMPTGVRAELIGGVVYMPSPVKADHAGIHGELITWLTLYKAATPGTAVLDNGTQILSSESEPQPDAALIVVGGQTGKTPDGYVQGPAEFVAEVASSTESYDLHSKRADYERYGVGEYLVLVVRLGQALWFVRENNKFVEVPPGPDGIHRSPLMKGLWLDSAAMLRGDTKRVQEVLAMGLASADHAQFAAQLRRA